MINEKSRKIAVLMLMFTLIFSIILVSTSFAWLANRPLTPIGAEVVPGYYAGGKGTENDPYVIKKPIHLYNLAWLQSRGVYNTPKEGETLTQTYFVIDNDIDMTGYTLPPIGTTTHPFIGVFRSSGKEKVAIHNLTVSNIIENNEIVKRPYGVSTIDGAEIVGMFGVIGQYNKVPVDATYVNIVPRVENFYLVNPTIRTQTGKSLVGLIAGYVNGKVHEVGVLGGKILSGQKNTSGLTSDNISLYGLIGDRANNVGWDGVSIPGSEAGGTIKVDADDADTQTAANTAKNSGYAVVPNTVEDRAFIVGGNGISVGEKITNGFKFYNKVVRSGLPNGTVVGTGSNHGGSFVTVGKSTSNTSYKNIITNLNNDITVLEEKFIYNEDLDNVIARNDDGKYVPYVLDTGNVPNSGVLQEITLAEQVNGVNKKISVPKNGVWFKPIAKGHCLISFYPTNQGKLMYKSIYKYKRDANGNITDWTETIFSLSGNKAVSIFEYEISQADITEKYEYIIGSNEDAGSNVKFCLLALAGASNTGGGVTDTSLELVNVNFISQKLYDEGGVIADAGMKITTFYINLLAKNKEASVTFRRDSMDEHAVAENYNEQTDFDIYEYYHVVPTPQT